MNRVSLVGLVGLALLGVVDGRIRHETDIEDLELDTASGKSWNAKDFVVCVRSL